MALNKKCAVFAEFFCAAFIILGLFTRLASIPLVIAMGVAVFFAHKGIHVHATDLSDGMIKQLQKKVLQNHLKEFLSVQQCSFTQLDEVKQLKFDHIFSNFGGLNCVEDLRSVTKYFDSLLKKNGGQKQKIRYEGL